MTLPTSFKAWRRTTGDLPRTIEQTTEHLPSELSPGEVIIKIHAVSLNFRDIGMLDGRYPVQVKEHGIAASDCAAEVVAVGSGVKGFQVGDRVSPTFILTELTGKEKDGFPKSLGDDQGVLAEYAVFDEKVLVKLPTHLSWEEGSTLACAGVTAWNCLNRLRDVDPEDTTVLLQGTGGVSMFCLLICIAAGIKTIITSSSDAKIEEIKKLSPLVQGINYKTHPNQAEGAKKLTDGKGVDFVLNNVGPVSLPADIDSLRAKHGTISMIGFLDQSKPTWDPLAMLQLMFKAAKLQGIRVGSKVDFQELNQFLEEKQVKLDTLIDRTFQFDDAKAAFEHLKSGKHVGKIVIKV
ncbi:chaperonin 10-like protein [Lophiotrema nucula]|uniref:Chaperonin 10-like protein n=1 Tax=Lophiotrema nucula TaxID=690887 RepID=A0A6A5ZIM9_9PLEO|nr:chaperonin 10-like protein [Lophiotrema nucula]